MAVSRMRLATVAGSLGNFDEIVQKCVIGREFHPEPSSSLIGDSGVLSPFPPTNPYIEPLRHAERLYPLLDLTPDFESFEQAGLTAESAEKYLNDLDDRFSALRDEKEALETRIRDNKQILIQLDTLRDVNIPIDSFFHLEYLKFRYGKMPKDNLDRFYPFVKTRNDVFFFITDEQKDTTYGFYLTPHAVMEEVDKLFEDIQFERIRLPGRIEGNHDDAVRHIHKDIEAARSRRAEIKQNIHALAREEKEPLRRVTSYLRFMSGAHGVRQYAARSEESFFLMGWIPEDAIPAFTRDLGAQKASIMVTEDPDVVAQEPDFVPPSKLRNAKLFKPFEPFVGMYGLPSYGEVDPTPIMAIFYPLIFGIMFGDVGHGVLLLCAGLLMYNKFKMWIGKVLCYCSVFSILFGALFGSIFGYEEYLTEENFAFPFFKVLEGQNTHSILEMTLYGGFLIITFAMIMNIFIMIRAHKNGKAIWGNNSLLFIPLYVGVVFFFLPYIGFNPFPGYDEHPIPGVVLAILVALPCLILFLREPIEYATHGKAHGHEKPSVITCFVEVFETLLSFVTNTLSFLRVGAYAVSHASMMSVVYMLAKAEHNLADGNVVTLIIGNLIVAGIEGFLVAIQVLRLNFYEIFGRFFEGSGRPYRPLTIDYKAIDGN